MPLNLVTGLFQRARSFVDLFAAGDDITREDLDIECNDLAAGINAALTNSLNFVGEWPAVGTFPTTRPDFSTIRPRDTWRVTAPGTVGGVAFAADDYLVAMQDSPGPLYAGNWMRIPNLFLPVVLATLADAEAAAAAAGEFADDAEGSANDAASSALAASNSATAALNSLNQTLLIADSLPSQRGSWLTGTAYGLGDLVQFDGSSYICLIAHTSGTFATDLSALRWTIFAARGAPGAGTGDLLAAQNLNDVSDKSTARINLQTLHYVASATAPSTPMARMLWRDTSVSPSRLYLRNDANTAWTNFDPVYAGLLTSASILIADLNTHVTGGVYRSASGATGNPLAGEGFRFAYWAGADSSSGTEIAVGDTSGRVFVRNRTSNTYGLWDELFNMTVGGQILAGVTAAPDADGTFSSGTYTPTIAGGNFKAISNAGAFTLAVPLSPGVYTMVVEITNVAGAGAITFSGFDRVAGDGLTTTVGHRFQVFITRTSNGVTASVLAMQ